MQPTTPALGDAIRDRRTARGMTQEQLATATGLTKTTIQNLENGRSNGQRITLRLIAEALHTDAATLRGRHVEQVAS